MADAEITQEEVKLVDINQVASMQLKDGTTVVVQGEGEGEDGYEGNFVQEEVDEGAYEYGEEPKDEQQNQLRAMPRYAPGYHRPPPVVVRPVHPVPPPKPVFVPRGPVVRPPIARPTVPLRPTPVVPLKPVGMPGRGGVAPNRPLVSQMITSFRARPVNTDVEEYKEEEFPEEAFCECDNVCETDENQFRARPMFIGPRPPVMPRRMVVAPVRPAPRRPVVHRGPVPRGPFSAYNTFQPLAFRNRPGVPFRRPMGVHVPGTFQPRPIRPLVRPAVVFPPKVVPNRTAYMLPRVYRARPRSSSYDAQETFEEVNYQCNNEGCESNVCTRCGKEF